MKLGLKRDEVRLVDFTPEWHEEFVKVKKEIQKKTGLNENRMEHIGSTAIKDMAAKPIVDIVVGIDDLECVDQSIISGLIKVGFLRLKVERPGEIVFAMFTDDTFEEKTHFIHMVVYQGELWNNLIFFRDYLNANEAARKQYLELKLNYLEEKSYGINAYTDHKEEFVKNIFRKRLR